MSFSKKENLTEAFETALESLIGKECWGITGGNGSMVTFDFGEKIGREKQVENQNLSDEVRNFESELSLFVQCVWRVESKNDVLFGAWTEHEIVNRESAKILHQTVKKVEIFKPAFDLQITFSNDCKLSIFCDQTNDVDKNDNYDFSTPKTIYTVSHKNILEVSEHDK